MAEEKPIEGDIDKQKIIREIEQTQITKIGRLMPVGVDDADSKLTTKKLDNLVDDTKITRKRPVAGGAPIITQPTMWGAAKSYRKELSILFTLAVGILWLWIAYISRDAVPLAIAATLILPTIFYIIQNFRRGF